MVLFENEAAKQRARDEVERIATLQRDGKALAMRVTALGESPNRPRMIELIAAHAEACQVYGERDGERIARTALLAEYDRVTGYDPTSP